jgi:hypothetical protein
MKKTYFISYIDRKDFKDWLGKNSFYRVVSKYLSTNVSYNTDLKVFKKHSKCYKVNFKNETIATFQDIKDAKDFAIRFATEKNL